MHLTDLMTDDDVLVLGDYVDALIDVTVQEGISRSMAAECGRALANVTIRRCDQRGARDAPLRMLAASWYEALVVGPERSRHR